MDVLIFRCCTAFTGAPKRHLTSGTAQLFRHGTVPYPVFQALFWLEHSATVSACFRYRTVKVVSRSSIMTLCFFGNACAPQTWSCTTLRLHLVFLSATSEKRRAGVAANSVTASKLWLCLSVRNKHPSGIRRTSKFCPNTGRVHSPAGPP